MGEPRYRASVRVKSNLDTKAQSGQGASIDMTAAGERRPRYDAATAHLDPPFAILDLAALEGNAAALTERSAGKPIRVATKSVRSRDILREVLARPGWHGLMTYALAEALWLHRDGVSDDLVMGYP